MTAFDLDRLGRSRVVETLEYYHQSGSTQDRARRRLDRPTVLPLLVLAEQQSGGRGRGAGVWWSEPGSLTFSYVFHLSKRLIEPSQLGRLSCGVAGAVCQVVQPLLPRGRCGVKWPNDVLIDGRKLAGILIETVASRQIDHPVPVIVGVGLNANNPASHSPEPLRGRTTALIDCVHRPIDPTELLLDLLESIDGMLEMLRRGDPALARLWRDHSVLDGRRITVQRGRESLIGRCAGLDEHGALLLKYGDRIEPLLDGHVVEVEPPMEQE